MSSKYTWYTESHSVQMWDCTLYTPSGISFNHPPLLYTLFINRVIDTGSNTEQLNNNLYLQKNWVAYWDKGGLAKFNYYINKIWYITRLTTNILQWQQGNVVYCPQELVIHSTIPKHIVKDTSDNMLSVLLSATMPNTSTVSHSQRTFSLFIHLYVDLAIYIHLPERYVRWHWATLEQQRKTPSSGL